MKMWEIKEQGYKSRYMRDPKEEELESAYNCGFDHGYEAAMREMDEAKEEKEEKDEMPYKRKYR